MSRTVPEGILDALSEAEIEPFFAVELDLDTDPIRLWTGYGDKTISGHTYLGAGDLLVVSGLEEVNDLSAREVTITLNGLNEDLVTLAFDTPIQNRPVRVYWGINGVTDEITGETVAVEVFTGRANTIPIEDSGESSTITLGVDSKLVILERSSKRRYTQESHKTRYSGDSFFSYVTLLQDKSVVWGRKEKASDNA